LSFSRFRSDNGKPPGGFFDAFLSAALAAAFFSFDYSTNFFLGLILALFRGLLFERGMEAGCLLAISQ